MEFQLPSSRYPVSFSTWPNFREIHRFNEALLSRLTVLPGVESAAIAGNHPLDAGFTNSFVVVGREAEARNWPEISIRRVTPGYFRTVGVSLIQGRLLQDSDGTSANPVLLINKAAARRFFPSRNPLGQQIGFWGSARTIVGVVGNEKIHGVTEPDPLAVYAPLAQMPSMNGAESLLLLVNGDPASMVSAVRAAVREQDPALAIFGVAANR